MARPKLVEKLLGRGRVHEGERFPPQSCSGSLRPGSWERYWRQGRRASR
jgi:hypothetical protein